MTSLMSVSFPSIWLEFKDQKGEKMLKVRKAFSQLQEGIDKIVCYFLDPKL